MSAPTEHVTITITVKAATTLLKAMESHHSLLGDRRSQLMIMRRLRTELQEDEYLELNDAETAAEEATWD